jgi:hypothetical protein
MEMMHNKNRIIGVLMGVGVALVVFVCCYIGVWLLGIATGVIAPCATCPEW